MTNPSRKNPNGRLAAIEDLCERLIHRFGEDLGEAGYKAWASLLNETGKRFPDAQLRASLPTLPFAMGKRDFSVSALIATAFPAVYFELLRSTGDEDFKRLPALLALPLSIFIDWDRAKSARHELVDAYIYSSWPPADLLLTSMAAGIQSETLHRLAGTHRGRDYLASILKSVVPSAPSRVSVGRPGRTVSADRAGGGGNLFHDLPVVSASTFRSLVTRAGTN